MTSKDHRAKPVSLPHPKKAREAKGLTQRQLAELVPTTQCGVFRCERSGTYPKQVHLRAAYLKALGLSEAKP